MRKKIHDGLTKSQRYHRRHPERRREQFFRFREANREELNRKRREFYYAHPEAWRRDHLRRSYGMTNEQFDAMYTEQNGACAICGVDFSELARRPCVDHDHSTGDVRALLCGTCNMRVGIVEGNQSWRPGVLAYLALHKRTR